MTGAGVGFRGEVKRVEDEYIAVLPENSCPRCGKPWTFLNLKRIQTDVKEGDMVTVRGEKMGEGYYRLAEIAKA